MSASERLERAWYALEGLSVGDAFGEFFEFSTPEITEHHCQTRTTAPPPWRYTDDTLMALSVYSILRQCGAIDQDRLALSFATHYDPTQSYGQAMHDLLNHIRRGESWRALAPALFHGQGSFGNGAAMRVAPVGAYFADDLPAVGEYARRSAQVTHAHPEGAAGAIAAAVATAIAWQVRTADLRPTRPEFLDQIQPFVPESEVRAGICRARDLPPGTSVQAAVMALGNGSRVLAQDTVPFTLWCAGEYLDHYEEALWQTLSGLGDCDTNCAIVGGIVVMATGVDGIPSAWRTSREPLPAWAFEETTPTK